MDLLLNIFGFVKCKILAPRKLYFPVLPMKCNAKLVQKMNHKRLVPAVMKREQNAAALKY